MPSGRPLPSVDHLTRSFTSWKLDLLAAICADPRVSTGMFRVAFAIMEFINKHARMTFVSERRLAITSGFKERAVRKHLRELVQLGLLRKWRRGRSNVYSFVDLYQLEENLRLAGFDDEDAEKPPADDGTTVPVHTGTTVPTNTF